MHERSKASISKQVTDKDAKEQEDGEEEEDVEDERGDERHTENSTVCVFSEVEAPGRDEDTDDMDEELGRGIERCIALRLPVTAQ